MYNFAKIDGVEAKKMDASSNVRFLGCTWLHYPVIKTFPENWDSKAPSVGTLLAYLKTTS